MSAIDEIEEWKSIADRYLAAVESLQTIVAGYKSLVSEYDRIADLGIAELEALRQERDGLRADAARYRWLRHGDNDELVCVPWMLRNEKLDAAIDAAMAKEQGE